MSDGFHDAIHNLRQQLAVMRKQMQRISVHEDEFQDWFDQQLFKVTHSQPSDYIGEVEANIKQLERATNADNQRWLAVRIEQQMLALQRALQCFQRKS